jgi:hypothetical protein
MSVFVIKDFCLVTGCKFVMDLTQPEEREQLLQRIIGTNLQNRFNHLKPSVYYM